MSAAEVQRSGSGVARLTINAARALTEEVKADAAALWSKLLTLYEGEAHVALGYGSWGEYYAEEFGQTGARGYQLLEAARVDRVLVDSNMVERPANDRVARELAPVLKDEGPEAVEEVWGEVVREHGAQPTAAQVREVVEMVREIDVGPRKLSHQSRVVGGVVNKARLIRDAAPHLDYEVITALSEEVRAEWKQELSSARTVLSRLIAAL